MNPVPANFRSGRTAGIPFPVLAGIALFLLPAFAPSASLADIFRWEDDRGTIHYTDDVSTIPPQHRKNSTLMIREAPAGAPDPQTTPSPGPPKPAGDEQPPPLPSPEDSALAAARERDELASQVEQLKAKIAAKEQHIRNVDGKQSLAVNPLRNRFVDQPDLDLYKKYEIELPGDRDRLRELESRLESLK